jgi:hypothetical protein
MSKKCAISLNWSLMSSSRVALIDASWYDDWHDYIETGDDRPGEINNQPLISTSSSGVISLRSRLIDQQHFEFISLEMWDKLYSWYGGGPKVEIWVIQDEPDMDPITVNVYHGAGVTLG